MIIPQSQKSPESKCESLNIGKPGNNGFKSPYSPCFGNFSKELFRISVESTHQVRATNITVSICTWCWCCGFFLSSDLLLSPSESSFIYRFQTLSISTGFKGQTLDKVTFGQLSIKNKEPTSVSHLNFFDIERKIFELRKLIFSLLKSPSI